MRWKRGGGGRVKYVTFTKQWFFRAQDMVQSVDGNYYYIRYVFRPLQPQNPTTVSTFPNSASSATTYHSISQRKEMSYLAYLYKQAVLKGWSIRVQKPSTVRTVHVDDTSVAGESTRIEYHLKYVPLYVFIGHEQTSYRTTDALDQNQAGLAYLQGNFSANAPEIHWPDIDDVNLEFPGTSGTVGSSEAGTRKWSDMMVDGRLKQQLKTVKKYYYKPMTRPEQILKKINLHNARRLEEGTSSDTVLGTGVEDDQRIGGFMFVVPADFLNSTTYGVNGVADVVDCHFHVQFKFRLAVFNRG